MKKVLIVLACIALVLPLFALSAFAEDDTYDVSFFNQRSSTVTLHYSDGTSDYYVNVSPNSSVTLSLLGNTTYSFYVVVGSYNGFLYYRLPDTSGRQLSGDSSDPTIFDSSELPVTIYISGSDTTTLSRYYLSVSVPLPDPLSPVNDGVTTFIGYGGDVLSFLTSTPAILTLIGLSVGLAFIIPFGIRKIKEMVKGY